MMLAISAKKNKNAYILVCCFTYENKLLINVFTLVPGQLSLESGCETVKFNSQMPPFSYFRYS